jgi:HD superfamily phosphohydrolase YqeK
VAGLLEEWGATLDLPEDERVRWRAAGLLHDALKDAPTEELRTLVPGHEDWPDSLLHAPAAAARLAAEGVEDQEFLLAVRYHSIGHAEFRQLGEHLYLADYLEPGRPDSDERVMQRRTMPNARSEVLPLVIRRRIEAQLASDQVLLQPAVDFWNRTVA